jgi:hypothetical protein
MVMVFNATFKYISAISWQSVVLVEETGSIQRKPSTLLHNDNLLVIWTLAEFGYPV